MPLLRLIDHVKLLSGFLQEVKDGYDLRLVFPDGAVRMHACILAAVAQEGIRWGTLLVLES